MHVATLLCPVRKAILLDGRVFAYSCIIWALRETEIIPFQSVWLPESIFKTIWAAFRPRFFLFLNLPPLSGETSVSSKRMLTWSLSVFMISSEPLDWTKISLMAPALFLITWNWTTSSQPLLTLARSASLLYGSLILVLFGGFMISSSH